MGDDLVVPVGVIQPEIVGMQFNRGGWSSVCNLGTSFQAGPTAAAERFISDHDATGILIIPLPDAVHASINAGPAMEAMFFVDQDTIPRKGLSLFTNLLVESCSNHIEEPAELRAIFHLLDEANHFLNREVDSLRQIFFEVIVKPAMF